MELALRCATATATATATAIYEALVPFLNLEFDVTSRVSQPTSIVSYNHLGNNDGMNLSAPQTFRSKEISKSNVVDDMVASNSILYEPGEHPDHVVVIKVYYTNSPRLIIPTGCICNLHHYAIMLMAAG